MSALVWDSLCALRAFLVFIAPYAITLYFVVIVVLVVLLALKGHSDRARHAGTINRRGSW